jgi:hypothetical protein
MTKSSDITDPMLLTMIRCFQLGFESGSKSFGTDDELCAALNEFLTDVKQSTLKTISEAVGH